MVCFQLVLTLFYFLFHAVIIVSVHLRCLRKEFNGEHGKVRFVSSTAVGIFFIWYFVCLFLCDGGKSFFNYYLIGFLEET